MVNVTLTASEDYDTDIIQQYVKMVLKAKVVFTLMHALHQSKKPSVISSPQHPLILT